VANGQVDAAEFRSPDATEFIGGGGGGGMERFRRGGTWGSGGAKERHVREWSSERRSL